MRGRAFWWTAAIGVALSPVAIGAQASRPDSLLARLAGQWVLEGRMAGKETVLDVSFRWVLDSEYLEMHEVSRERAASGRPAYEAIVYFGRDAKTHEYAALWLDNTAYGAFAPAGTGRGAAAGDSIRLVFTYTPESHVYNTLMYHPVSDRWEMHIDNEDHGTSRPFARVTLTRR